MIIPSIDIIDGQAVQLIGGKEKALDGGEPLDRLEEFSIAGEVAVIDLDAAMSKGNNKEKIQQLCRYSPCRVGGGIRDIETAREWLNAGASKIILGTKAVPEILKELPKERVIAALDAVNGEVVVEGWATKTGRGILEGIQELRDYVGGFLITFVEKEGKLAGTNMYQVAELVAAAQDARVTIAGGVTTAEEIAALHKLGADAQVGMALYTKKMDLGNAISAPLTSDREDGLFPTVVCDERGIALGLCWSNHESISEAVRTKRGVYHSRKRGLWRKGESSGAIQELKKIELDCDNDALKFVVKQHGAGFCHLERYTCWGKPQGLGKLEQTLQQRKTNAPEGSYTARLFNEPELLAAKIREESEELIQALTNDKVAEITHEAADVLYFTLTGLAAKGIALSKVEQELDFRALKVTRRPGNAKP